jgi:YHS domain-containing protein
MGKTQVMKKTIGYKEMIICLILCFVSVILISCKAPPERVNAENGYAIKGFDPVAYFTAGEPVKGDKRFAYQWKGATWLFSAESNRVLFINDPERYAPQYGGY